MFVFCLAHFSIHDIYKWKKEVRKAHLIVQRIREVWKFENHWVTYILAKVIATKLFLERNVFNTIFNTTHTSFFCVQITIRKTFFTVCNIRPCNSNNNMICYELGLFYMRFYENRYLCTTLLRNYGKILIKDSYREKKRRFFPSSFKELKRISNCFIKYDYKGS